jgi:uncharacterized membrane protein YqaE (UPF0057 family)
MAKKVNNVVLIILAILLPPVAVFLKEGVKMHFWINIVLCFIFWIPAIIHALWIVLK